MRLKHSILIGFCLGFAAVAHGEIVWETTRRSPVFDDGKDATAVVFVGRNVGRDAKVIESISSSCDCAKANATRSKIAPGESCEIQVAISRGPKNPTPGSLIHVVMEKGEIHALTVERENVDRVQATPAFVWWKVGERPVAREIFFESGEATLPITAVSIQNADDNFVFQSERMDEHRWCARITPRKLEAASVSSIQFAITRAQQSGRSEQSQVTVYAKIAEGR